MPTKERLQSAIIELSEQLPRLGYEVTGAMGPVDRTGQEVDEDEVEADQPGVDYYIFARARTANFYIKLPLAHEFAMIVYPMNVLRYLGKLLNKGEAAAILDEPVEWSDLGPEAEDLLMQEAAEKIIENTDPERYIVPAFNLSSEASTSLVQYRQTTTDDGFPTEFQCTRGLFPYSERQSLPLLDNRLDPVLIAGERGRRYVQYSFRFQKDGRDPSEYEFMGIV